MAQLDLRGFCCLAYNRVYSSQATWKFYVLGAVQVSRLNVLEGYTEREKNNTRKWKRFECTGRSADLDEKTPGKFSEI